MKKTLFILISISLLFTTCKKETVLDEEFGEEGHSFSASIIGEWKMTEIKHDYKYWIVIVDGEVIQDTSYTEVYDEDDGLYGIITFHENGTLNIASAIADGYEITETSGTYFIENNTLTMMNTEEDGDDIDDEYEIITLNENELIIQSQMLENEGDEYYNSEFELETTIKFNRN